MLALILAPAIAATPAIRAPLAAASAPTVATPRPVPPPATIPQPFAQPGPGMKPGASGSAVAGAWRLAEVGGRIDCTLTLADGGNPPSRAVQAPIACQRAFPPLKAITTWSVGSHGAPVLAGPKTKPLAFTGPAGGPYVATAPDGRVWRLTAAPDKAAAAAH